MADKTWQANLLLHFPAKSLKETVHNKFFVCKVSDLVYDDDDANQDDFDRFLLKTRCTIPFGELIKRGKRCFAGCCLPAKSFNEMIPYDFFVTYKTACLPVVDRFCLKTRSTIPF